MKASRQQRVPSHKKHNAWRVITYHGCSRKDDHGQIDPAKETHIIMGRMDYWSRKEEYRDKAEKHTSEMYGKYADEINACIENSLIYGGDEPSPMRSGTTLSPNFYFINTDSVSALKISASKNKAVLNFASYKTPGGRFLDGSTSQEEMLCHSSFLYNVLRAFPQYYSWNNLHKNRAMYRNRAVFTPGVVFDEETVCGVITCAAPNIKAGRKYCNVNDAENLRVLEGRLEFIRDIAEENDIKTLIIGAFGCGVFGQNPEDVCDAIKKAFSETSLHNIVVAVPGNDINAEIFRRSFGRR